MSPRPSLLEEEIHEQPQVLRLALQVNAEPIRRIVEQLQARPPQFVLIAARGSSDNAANYAKYVFGALNRMPVALAAPSLHTLYERPPNMHGGLVIGISQSGRGEDVRAVLETAREQGAMTLAITNAADSPLAGAADNRITLGAGQERSVAATKTYTATLAVIARLAAEWQGDEARLSELANLSEWAEQVLPEEQSAASLAQDLCGAKEMIVVGRGFNDATAHEIALKIKELTYIPAEGYSAADLRHGPIAVVEPGLPVLAVAPPGRALQDMEEVIGELEKRGAEVYVISHAPERLTRAGRGMRLPVGLAEWLSPIVAVIPGQMLALHLALCRGVNPDQPRGLRKVTSTR